MDEISHNYATALYGLLGEKDRELCLKELDGICAVFHREVSFYRLLDSPNLSKDEKVDLIDKTFGKTIQTPHLVAFMKVVSSHHRIRHFDTIVEEFRALLHADTGVKDGIVYSAVKLTPTQIEDLCHAMSKKVGAKVSLSNIVDHRLLGGVRVALDGKVYDASLSAKLASMRRKLNGGKQS